MPVNASERVFDTVAPDFNLLSVDQNYYSLENLKGKHGTVIFGHHTTPKKVSIDTDKFKSISVDDLNNLTADKFYSEINERLKLIN